MTGSDWFLLISTFVVGLVSGAYLYTTAFKPIYQPENSISRSERIAEDFSIVGKAYGGLHPAGYTQPLVRITGDGSYSYFPPGIGVSSEDPQKGVLPSSLFGVLFEEIDQSDLEVLSHSSVKEECRIFYDGVDYVYRIVLDGTEYELDTCNTALTYDHPIATIMDDVWSYVADPQNYNKTENTTSNTAKDSPRNFLERFLRSYFVDDESIEDEPVACTMEAKLCPDGSAVGRTGPNCEFASCPGS